MRTLCQHVRAALPAALAKVARYSIDAGNLTLADSSGAPLLVYAAGSPNAIEGNWLVTGYYNGNDAHVSVISGSRLTMNFGADGTVEGNAGCNQYGGGYSVDGDNIAIGPLHATMMACPDEALSTQESQFLAALDMPSRDVVGDRSTGGAPGGRR